MPAGRPTKYREEYAEQAQKLCLLGHTNQELAQFFQVEVTTISKWLRDIPEFSNAVYEGRDGADEKVAQSLYKRAMGMTVLEQRPGGDAGTVTIAKELPPDVQALRFWLMNRQRAKWTDQQKVEIEGKVTKEIDFKGLESLPTEDLEQLARIAQKIAPPGSDPS